MEKKLESGGIGLKIPCHKVILVMKLTCFLMCCLLFNVQAAVKAQGQTVSLKLDQVSVAEAIRQLKEQTQLDFFFSNKQVDVDRKVSLDLQDIRLDEALKMLLGEGYSYEFLDDVVVIKPVEVKNPEMGVPQEKVTVKGVVRDEKGELLPGVTVTIKGTSLGTATDVDGKWKLDLPKMENIVLVFSFVGMQSQEVVYKGQEEMNVMLKTDTKQMKEVVVTGYFNQAKESFTGTATSFSGDELREVNPVNALAALSVLDPSFKMIENITDGSNPNVVPKFEVRGSSSMPNVKDEYEGDPNMPTFIMDGFEVDAEKVFDLDPNRIESMTLLKDAAATAIYGSRASNGVVVITTKMPEKGTIHLTYNMDLSFNIPDLRDYDLLNAREKLELEKAAGFYSSTVANLLEEREAQYNYKLQLVEQGHDTYWLNKPLQVAIGHKHSLFVEGGENLMRYSLDLSYEKAPGVMKESGRERIGAGMLLQYQMKKIVFRNQMTYDVVNADNSPYGSFSEYARANPYYIYEDEDGNYLYLLEDDTRGAFDKVPNPLYNAQLNVIDRTSYSDFTNNFSIDWYITDALRLKGNVAIHHRKDEGVVFKSAKHIFTNIIQ